MKTFGLVVVFGTLAVAQPSVDWTSFVVRTTTRTATPQEDVAREEVTRQFMATLRALNYDQNRTVGEYLDENPYIASQLERIVLSPRRAGTRFLTDGSAELEYDVSLTGPVFEALLPTTGGGKLLTPLCCPTCKRPWPEGVDVPPGVALVPREEENAIPYTGVLIDARGLGLVPALLPRIVDEEGREVYGTGFVLRSYATERGLMSYVTSSQDAYQNERLGVNPLRVTALRARGRNRTELVIANPDAQKIHSALGNVKLLERGQVVALIDQ